MMPARPNRFRRYAMGLATGEPVAVRATLLVIATSFILLAITAAIIGAH
jgi:hypothetical protein